MLTPVCLLQLLEEKKFQSLRRNQNNLVESEDNNGLSNDEAIAEDNVNNDPQQRRKDASPLYDASWARVVEFDAGAGVITGFTEESLIPCRIGIETSEPILPSTRIYIGNGEGNAPKGTILGGAILDRMSNSAKLDFPLILQLFIEEFGMHFVQSFFNKAGNLSLKQHAFELLDGIGNKKAQQMVELRGSSGFASMAELNEKCGIDAAELLARRFFSEIEDRTLQPRLIDHLLPVNA
jgi:predicted nucleic acid-binding OB-fold protein